MIIYLICLALLAHQPCIDDVPHGIRFEEFTQLFHHDECYVVTIYDTNDLLNIAAQEQAEFLKKQMFKGFNPSGLPDALLSETYEMARVDCLRYTYTKTKINSYMKFKSNAHFYSDDGHAYELIYNRIAFYVLQSDNFPELIARLKSEKVLLDPGGDKRILKSSSSSGASEIYYFYDSGTLLVYGNSKDIFRPLMRDRLENEMSWSESPQYNLIKNSMKERGYEWKYYRANLPYKIVLDYAEGKEPVKQSVDYLSRMVNEECTFYITNKEFNKDGSATLQTHILYGTDENARKHYDQFRARSNLVTDDTNADEGKIYDVKLDDCLLTYSNNSSYKEQHNLALGRVRSAQKNAGREYGPSIPKEKQKSPKSKQKK